MSEGCFLFTGFLLLAACSGLPDESGATAYLGARYGFRNFDADPHAPQDLVLSGSDSAVLEEAECLWDGGTTLDLFSACLVYDQNG